MSNFKSLPSLVNFSCTQHYFANLMLIFCYYVGGAVNLSIALVWWMGWQNLLVTNGWFGTIISWLPWMGWDPQMSIAYYRGQCY